MNKELTKDLIQPQSNDDVEEYIAIIQDSCAECKYSCWYKGNYDLDACELNKNMNELDLNASMIGDGCPLPNLIKQHIQAQTSKILDLGLKLDDMQEDNYLLKSQLNEIGKLVNDRFYAENVHKQNKALHKTTKEIREVANKSMNDKEKAHALNKIRAKLADAYKNDCDLEIDRLESELEKEERNDRTTDRRKG